MAPRRAMCALIIASAGGFKSIFLQAKFTKQFVFGQYTSPMRIIVLLSYPQSGVKALHIVIDLKNITLESNKKLILVEMFDFALTQVDNFCENELITVKFKLFDGKDESLVLFRPEREAKLSVQMLNHIHVTMFEQFVFCFRESILKFKFG